jgi:hypothetical protein
MCESRSSRHRSSSTATNAASTQHMMCLRQGNKRCTSAWSAPGNVDIERFNGTPALHLMLCAALERAGQSKGVTRQITFECTGPTGIGHGLRCTCDCEEVVRGMMRRCNADDVQGRGLSLGLRGGSSRDRFNGTAAGGHTLMRGGRGGEFFRGSGVASMSRESGGRDQRSLPPWASGTRGVVPEQGRRGRGDGAWWSGAKRRTPPLSSPGVPGGNRPPLGGESSANVYKRAREEGGGGGGDEYRKSTGKREEVVELGDEEGMEEDADEEVDNEEGEEDEKEEDADRLRAMYLQAAREHPDVEFQKLKKEEEDEEKEESRLIRTVVVLIAPGFSEASESDCMCVHVLVYVYGPRARDFCPSRSVSLKRP